MTYLEEHLDDLRALFDAVDRTADWTDDPDQLVAYMEQRWLGTEHGARSGKDELDPGAAERAWPVLERLGVVGQVAPPRAAYDQVVVMGASGIGLHRRLELVRTSGVETAMLTVLAGMRPTEPAARDGAIGELLAAEGRFGAAAGWAAPPAALRAHGLLTGVDELAAAAVVFSSETDLARLLIGKQWPAARLVGIETTDDGGVPNELGTRQVRHEDYAVPAGPISSIRLVNGKAVDRGAGRAPRPTSRSTIAEWLGREATGLGSVLVVVNQPHLWRVHRELQAEVVAAGRSDLVLDVAGCAVDPRTADLLLMLGEIPARINGER